MWLKGKAAVAYGREKATVYGGADYAWRVRLAHNDTFIYTRSGIKIQLTRSFFCNSDWPRFWGHFIQHTVTQS